MKRQEGQGRGQGTARTKPKATQESARVRGQERDIVRPRAEWEPGPGLDVDILVELWTSY